LPQPEDNNDNSMHNGKKNEDPVPGENAREKGK
jgi:hypothetical protein